ncbi:MFS transporter [Patescibacteria group bacterium]
MQKERSKYSSNNWKIGVSMVVNDTAFAVGVYVIFMLFIKLSLSEVSIVISMWLILSSIGQIPSGIFADRYGYKRSLIIGSIFFLCGTILFAFAQNFYWFLAGYSLMGFGSAMKQGADQALLYEGLKSDGKSKLYKKVAGKLDLYGNIFLVITAILGSLMYSVNERLPFYAEILLVIISIIIVITLREPKKESKHFPVLTQIKSSMKQAFDTPNFSKIFIFSALIGSISITAFQYFQPLYKSIGIDEVYFGLIASGAFILRGLGAWSAEKVGNMFNIDKYMVLHASIFGLFLILLQKTTALYFVLPIIAIFYFLRGLYAPTVSTYINDKVDSSKRATMLSVNSQLLTVISSISLLFAGYIADKYDLSTTFFVISVTSLVFLILYVLSLRKVKAY